MMESSLSLGWGDHSGPRPREPRLLLRTATGVSLLDRDGAEVSDLPGFHPGPVSIRGPGFEWLAAPGGAALILGTAAGYEVRSLSGELLHTCPSVLDLFVLFAGEFDPAVLRAVKVARERGGALLVTFR